MALIVRFATSCTHIIIPGATLTSAIHSSVSWLLQLTGSTWCLSGRCIGNQYTCMAFGLSSALDSMHLASQFVIRFVDRVCYPFCG